MSECLCRVVSVLVMCVMVVLSGSVVSCLYVVVSVRWTSASCLYNDFSMTATP